jgi:hypothetical protein
MLIPKRWGVLALCLAAIFPVEARAEMSVPGHLRIASPLLRQAAWRSSQPPMAPALSPSPPIVLEDQPPAETVQEAPLAKELPLPPAVVAAEPVPSQPAYLPAAPVAAAPAEAPVPAPAYRPLPEPAPPAIVPAPAPPALVPAAQVVEPLPVSPAVAPEAPPPVAEVPAPPPAPRSDSPAIAPAPADVATAAAAPTKRAAEAFTEGAMPEASTNNIKQQLWQEWAEKFTLLQRENDLLRDQIRGLRQDGLGDIRVDAVANIENEALKKRIAELEGEIETMRSQKPEAGKKDKIPPGPSVPNDEGTTLGRPHF